MAQVVNVPQIAEKNVILSRRFYGTDDSGIFSLADTRYYNLTDVVRKYNEGLPSRAGALKGNYLLVIREVFYMMAQQMEKLRENDPSQYLEVLGNKMKSYPLETNCGEIAWRIEKNTGVSLHKETVRTALKIMEKAGIFKSPKPGVFWKVNTSRTTEIVKNEDGSTTKIIKLLKKGRGNFILYVNKAVCVMKTVLKSLDFASESSKKTSAETPDFTDKTKSFGQNNVVILKEQSSILNNKNNSSKSGVASPQLPKNLTSQSDNGNGTKSNKQNPRKSKTEYVKNNENLKQIAKARRESGANYLQRQAFYERVDRKLSKLNQSAPDLAAFMLLAQAKNRLFAAVSDEYWAKNETKVMYQLKLHLKSFDCPIWTAFRYVDWGISAAADYIERNPDQYPQRMPEYHPLAYFRHDNIVKNGREFMPQFKAVLQKWLPKYLKKLSVDASRDANFEKWQFISNEMDVAWRKLMIEFKTSGIYQLNYQAKTIKNKLVRQFRKLEIKKEWQFKAIRSFEVKLEAFILELRRKGEEDAVFEWEKIHDEFSKMKVA